MKQDERQVEEQVEEQIEGVWPGPVVPVQAGGYGGVEGLDDEELADEQELEKMAFIADWGPILRLPCEEPRSGIRPVIDESGHLDWGAFGTVDFERLYGRFNKAKYKADKLREQLKGILIMQEMILSRVASPQKYLILKHVRMGVLDLDDIEDWNMHAAACWFMRAIRIREQISELRQRLPPGG